MTTVTDVAAIAAPPVPRISPARRIALLVVALASAAAILYLLVVRQLPGLDSPLTVPWLAWVAAFAAGEIFVVHVQLQRDSHSFSLTDLVLVAGLFLLPPAGLVPAMVVGVGLALLLHRRQLGLKLAFNLAQHALVGCLATTVFATLAGGALLPQAWNWVAALAAVVVAQVTAGLCVVAAISLSQGALSIRELPKLLALSIPFALGVAAVGLLAAQTAVQNPASLGLFLLPSLLLIAGYRAHTRAREQQNNLRLLHEVTSLLYNSDDAAAGLTNFLTSVRGAFRAQVAEIVLFGEGDAPDSVSRSSEGAEPVALVAVEHAEEIGELVTRMTEADTLTVRTGADRGTHFDAYAAQRGLKDAVVSLLRTEDRLHGLLLVADRLGDVATFTGSDRALLETFARHVATSLERGRLEHDLQLVTELKEQLRYQAMHDPLTTLPNRTLFLDRTQHALHLAGRNGLWPAVLYLDLDGFKPVNDSFGHQAGDVLLRVFAQRLHESVRSADTAARLGGDEFAVLLHGPIDREGAETVIARIQEQLTLPIDVGGGRTAYVGASIGGAFASSETDIETLIRHADSAMYTAKRSGRGRFLFHDPADDAPAVPEPAVPEPAADGHPTV